MHHRMRHFDSGRVAVDQDAAGLALERGQQGLRYGTVILGQEHGGGQLAVQIFRDLLELAGVAATDDKSTGAEDFCLQLRTRQEGSRIGSE